MLWLHVCVHIYTVYILVTTIAFVCSLKNLVRQHELSFSETHQLGIELGFLTLLIKLLKSFALLIFF